MNPDNPESYRCATLHDDTNHYGRRCDLEAGVFYNLRYLDCGNWANRIASLDVGGGCRLKLCTHTSLGGACDIYSTSGNKARAINELWAPMLKNTESLECTC